MEEQYDMTNLEIYKIPCKNCDCTLRVQGPVKTVDFNPKTGKAPLLKNVGKYYFACNISGCTYFRWFKDKWPKYIAQNTGDNTVSNTDNNTVSNTVGETEFYNEFEEIVNNLSIISLEMVDSNTKQVLKVKLEVLLEKLSNSSEIPKNKFDQYLKFTSDFLEMLN